MDVDVGLEINISRGEISVLLIHEFRPDHRTTQATNNICGTMGKDVLSIRIAQHWSHRFKNGDWELDDLPHTESPVQVDMDVLKQLIEEDPRWTTRWLAEQLGWSHTSVEKHLIQLGELSRYGVWIPCDLSLHQLQYRIEACMDLTTSHRNHEWLCNLLIDDEKWVLYINNAHQRRWLSAGQTGAAMPNTDPHPKKVMVSVWRGVKGVIHWETLPNGCTLTLLISTASSSTGSHKSSRESRIEFTSCMTTRDPMLQSRRDENYWSSDG